MATSIGSLIPTCAHASHTVVIGSGDSLDSLARRYHVAKRDIAKANGISQDTLLRNGRKLTIPDPPKTVSKAPTMRRTATLTRDRIAVRLGPNENYRRLSLLDRGSSLIATRKAGDWIQVELSSGKSGWIRSDFIVLGRAERMAAASGPKKAHKENSHSQHLALANHSRSKSDRRAAELHNKRLAALNMQKKIHKRQQAAERSQKKHRIAMSTGSKRHLNSHVVAVNRHGGRPEAEAPHAGSDIVRTAYAFRGVPYHWGGSSRSGFDCSGFTSYVYGRKGVNLPHSAADQFNHGKKVSAHEMKQGDLVFFSTTRRGISHVGIYVGDGKFVHASSGGGRVRVDSLQSGYYREKFRGARRMK